MPFLPHLSSTTVCSVNQNRRAPDPPFTHPPECRTAPLPLEIIQLVQTSSAAQWSFPGPYHQYAFRPSSTAQLVLPPPSYIQIASIITHKQIYIRPSTLLAAPIYTFLTLKMVFVALGASYSTSQLTIPQTLQ